MRRFLLVCLLATAGKADVSHLAGYNYEAGRSNGGAINGGSIGSFEGVGHGGSIGGFGGLGSLGVGHGGSISFGSAGNFNSGGLGGGSISFGSGSNFNSASLGGGFDNAGFIATNAGNTGSSHFETIPVSTEFTKEFYTFEAPEEEFNDAAQLQRSTASLKKNLQVVFVKTPENRGLEHAAVSLAKNVADSRTAIYVLHKQADVSGLAHKLHNIHEHIVQRPEVHFVKYRTQADAANAQQSIQAQYETLGGATVHKNGGVAQVLDFASSYAPDYQHNSGAGSDTVNIGGGLSGHDITAGGIGSIGFGTLGTGIGGSVAKVNIPSQTYLPAKH